MTTFFPPQDFLCWVCEIGSFYQSFRFSPTNKTPGDETMFSSSVAHLFYLVPLLVRRRFYGVEVADSKRRKHIWRASWQMQNMKTTCQGKALLSGGGRAKKQSNCSCGHLCSFIKDIYPPNVEGGRLQPLLQLYRLQTGVSETLCGQIIKAIRLLRG